MNKAYELKVCKSITYKYKKKMQFDVGSELYLSKPKANSSSVSAFVYNLNYLNYLS